jgi:hypothetical protein
MRTWQLFAELERRAVEAGLKKPDELLEPVKDFPGVPAAPPPRGEQARLPYRDSDDDFEPLPAVQVSESEPGRDPGQEG